MASVHHTLSPAAEQFDHADERWMGLVFAPGYEVSDHGRVRSSMTRRRGVFGAPRLLVLPLTRLGRYRLHLWVGGIPHHYHVHTLVLTAFVCPRPPKLVCRHLDGNPLNNRLDNLKWGTVAENQRDSYEHGTHAPGFLPGQQSIVRKLDQADVDEIRRLCGAGQSRKSLGKRFGVTTTTVTMIVERVTWKV